MALWGGSDFALEGVRPLNSERTREGNQTNAPMKSSARSLLRSLALLLLVVSPLAAGPAESSAVQPALSVTTAAPKDPYRQRRAEAPAEVTVVFTIDVKGKVVAADVVRTDNRAFNAATLDAIKPWTFGPALKDGKPVEVRL